MEQVEIKKYSSELKSEWDEFVRCSKNGTFLIFRNFMDYHSDRFMDFSLLFYFKNKLVALLPANKNGNILYSHQGLTYGGIIQSDAVTTPLMLEIFKKLRSFLEKNDIHELIYKSIPYIYHQKPSEEDLYALFRNKATLIGRSISSCLVLGNRIPYKILRTRGVKKALKEKLNIKESVDFSLFWHILENNLAEKYNVKPVHTLSEIEQLKQAFPQRIRLFLVFLGENILAGIVVFETECVAHIQYISASKEGKYLGALDLLFDYLIQNIYSEKAYFDFGTSTEDNGLFLNEGLISQKEGFGGRGIVYDIYKLPITNK